MKFNLLLAGFYYLLRFTAWRKEEFRNKLLEKDFTMYIGTEDRSKGRYYRCIQGILDTPGGEAGEPDFSLIWKDADTGYKVMSKASPKAIAGAVGRGALRLQGEASYVTWFLGILNTLMGYYTRK